jgi:DNA polymerase-3 subunit gamma/tau
VSPRPSGGRPAAPTSASADDDGGWPAAALPGGGGGGAGGATAPAPAREARSFDRPAKATPAKAPAKAAPAARTGGPAKATGGRPRSEAPPPDEPPFDPDYDRAPPADGYEGFDPGDEPLDDATPGVRQSSAEQALRAVTEHFAVERIGDSGPR